MLEHMFESPVPTLSLVPPALVSPSLVSPSLVSDRDDTDRCAGVVARGRRRPGPSRRAWRREGAVVATGTLGSALPNLVVESLLPPSPVLLLGDAEGIGRAGEGPVPNGSSGTDDRLTVVPPDPGRRPFVWVTGSADGPVRQVCLVFRADELDRRPLLIGWLECRSGRLVTGAPEAVAAWGPGVVPEVGLAAQARAYDAARRLRGLVVVACVPPGRYPVFALEGDGGYDAVMVDATEAAALPLAG
jgi:hypothetical protein